MHRDVWGQTDSSHVLPSIEILVAVGMHGESICHPPGTWTRTANHREIPAHLHSRYCEKAPQSKNRLRDGSSLTRRYPYDLDIEYGTLDSLQKFSINNLGDPICATGKAGCSAGKAQHCLYNAAAMAQSHLPPMHRPRCFASKTFPDDWAGAVPSWWG